ncbi:MAG: sulfotransferase [Streptosporangiaceae bacterium]
MVTELPEPAAACDSPVFMLCTGRSGSTLLRFLLDAHPDLACPPETRLPWLCTQLASAWSVIEDAPMPSSRAGQAPVPQSVIHGLRQSLTPMITSYLARHGKKRYCDKSIGGAQHARLLRQVWPGAKFICLYRHPMDVIGSGIEASPWGLGSYGFESYVAASPGNIVAALARYWTDYAGAILAAEAELGVDCLPVRYEDLVTDPEGQAERLFEFADVAPVPGITERCFTAERQRFGPGDYKIWNTTGVTSSSVGRGWQVPARLIPAELLAVVNDVAEQLGYVQIDETWGVGSPPADLRVPVDTSDPAPVPAGPVTAASPDSGVATPVTASATVLASGSTGQAGTVLADRVRAGLLNLGEEFTCSWKSCSAESVLLFATAPEPGRSAAWWRLDLGAGTATAGTRDRAVDTDWSVTGSADTWQRVLSGDLNLSVAFRGGQLRYADKGDYGVGSAGADNRVAMIAELLGITRWQPADPERAPSRLAS